MKKHLQLQKIAHKYGIDQIYAFGSRSKEIAMYLRGEEVINSHSKSDVDLGVCLTEDVSIDASQRVQIAIEMEDLLGVSRVDLVILDEADPFLALEIIRGEMLYTADIDRQSRYELYLLRRAGDLLPFKRERIRMILEEGAR